MIDPITLLTAGPTVLRAVGSLFGSDSTAAQVAGKIADVADAVAGKPPAQQRAAVNDAVAQLSPAEREALGQIQVRLAEIEAEREARRLQHDETLAGQVAATAQAEQQYGTTYAKDTRPMLARRSGLTGLVVGGLWTVAYLADLALGTGRVPPPDAVTISALMGMAYAYMGMRTADRFSARGEELMDAADRADDVIQGAVDRALENHARRPTGRQCTDGGVVICCDCEEPIDLRRLAAVPTATRCAGCQGVAER